jgi:hypothetical protein
MNRKVILYVGAFIVFIFALFHLVFWEMFNWNEELKKVTIGTAGVLQILNITSVYVLLFSAAVTVYIAVKNRSDFLSNILLLFVSGYFLLRIITGYYFFGWTIGEFIIWLLCLATASLFGFAAFTKGKNVKSETVTQK